MKEVMGNDYLPGWRLDMIVKKAEKGIKAIEQTLLKEGKAKAASLGRFPKGGYFDL